MREREGDKNRGPVGDLTKTIVKGFMNNQPKEGGMSGQIVQEIYGRAT
jgi:hypothetical protein